MADDSYSLYLKLSGRTKKHQDRDRSININIFGAVSRPGGQGSFFAMRGTHRTQIFLPGYPSDKIGDRGDPDRALCAKP